MNNIIHTCLALPKEERARLADILHESLRGKYVAGRYSDLLQIATSILGPGIGTKRRDSHCVIGRMLIAYKMRDEGYSLNQIGMMMGRHHATIIHLERMMEDVLRYPDCFKIEMAYWQEFIKKTKEHDIHSRTAQGS